MPKIYGLGKIMVMLQLLRKNGRMKLHELAKDLNANERTVRRYCDELRNAGYNIRGIGGKNGGYELVEVTLTETEWQIVCDKLKDCHGILDKIEYRLFKSL